MTVRLHVSVEPIDEAVHVKVKGKRADDGEYTQEFEFNTSAQTSPAIPIEYGDEIKIVVTTGKKIVLDSEQFVVRMEDPDTGEVKAAREEEKKKEKEAVEAHKEDSKKRAENAKKLETKFQKEAKEQEFPSKAPPFPAPLDIEGEEEADKREPKPGMSPRPTQAAQTSPVPPRGGAASSRDVK